MQVKDIVKPAVVVSESDTFERALEAMINGKTNTLLVIDEDGILCGEVTVADLLDAVVPDTLNGNEVIEHFASDEAFIASMDIAKDVLVSNFMTTDFTALTAQDDLMAIIATAIAHQRARIPVVDPENRPIGIISRQGLKQILGKFMSQT